MPPVCVKGVEGVPPVEVKRLRMVVVGVSFDIVVHYIPGHVYGIQALAPGLKCRRPEVHHDRLGLSSKFN